MKKGDILRLKNEYRSLYLKEYFNHPFIYWGIENKDHIGIMLTTSDKPQYKNIELKKEHFESGYPIEYGKCEKKSFIAPLSLVKNIEYKHFSSVGKLSVKGVTFIESIKSDLKYTDWRTHMNLNN
ncbi:MAG: hypothetical protein JXB49_18650 [Bacteroidales bacterium]|nr:hypothetical protein [Bacteroidales bacterium]